MRRGKPLVDTRQYYVVNPTGQRERGDFTREEAIAQAKRKERELKEWGYPRTKHRVVYAPTGEDVRFDGVKGKTMAKRRKRRANFGSAPLKHTHEVRMALRAMRGSSRSARAALRANHCTNADHYLRMGQYYLGKAMAHLESLGKHKAQLSSKMLEPYTEASLAFRKQCRFLYRPR